MTKLFSTIAVAIIATSMVSCGPSAEEKAKMEERAKQVADSIAAAISASMNEVAPEAAPVAGSKTPVLVKLTNAKEFNPPACPPAETPPKGVVATGVAVAGTDHKDVVAGAL